jgi:hypothetical protein
MAISQQQQQALHQQTNGRASQGDQTAKSKKRKGKQQISSNNNNSSNQQPKFAISEKQQVNTTSGKSASKENLVTSAREPQEKASPNEKTIASNRSQKLNQVSPLPVRESQNSTPLADSNNKKTSPVVAASAAHVLAKQISTDDQDDIDAGIELDGSSNSGSSVKDLNEDQIKSTSVSPVMAQSNLVNENRNSTKHAIEVAPMEQLAGSLCTDISPGKKVGSLTKQQILAANQQVIDADEQLLQQKLQSKQRKSSLGGSTGLVGDTSKLNVSTTSSGTPQQQQQQQSAGGSAGRGQVALAQSPTLCRICEQHVYQMERMMAEKSVYHKSCFRCYQCKIQLRIDNYSSHEGKVYCKAHHRQIFQPQVNLDNEDDVDIVAKSSKYACQWFGKCASNFKILFACESLLVVTSHLCPTQVLGCPA